MLKNKSYFYDNFLELWRNCGRVLSGERRNATEPTEPTEPMNKHTNENGIPYFSKLSDDGSTIYSFSEDFEDIWSQDIQDLYSPSVTGSLHLPRCGDEAAEFAEDAGCSYSDALVFCNMD